MTKKTFELFNFREKSTLRRQVRFYKLKKVKPLVSAFKYKLI